MSHLLLFINYFIELTLFYDFSYGVGLFGGFVCAVFNLFFIFADVSSVFDETLIKTLI